MLATFLALLAAHVVADFVLQFRWIIDNKHRFGGFALHALIVGITAVAALGAFGAGSSDALLAVLVVTVAHALIDAAKLWLSDRERIKADRRSASVLFLADQAAHLLTLVAVAIVIPQAWGQGFWASAMPQAQAEILIGFCLVSGFLLATRAGEFAIGLFMQGFGSAYANQPDDEGLPGAGTWIGLLERALIFILVLIDQFGAIGFLIAAKSILRFQYAKERSHSETVIIGTLASFTWAILISWLTANALHLII